MTRLGAALLALVLVAATGMSRSVSYQCLMDGQVRSACCCKKPQAESADCPQVTRHDQCCEIRVAEATRVPATTTDGSPPDRLPMLLTGATLPSSIGVPRLTTNCVVRAMGPRAPPGGVGPPLFVRNCSYLI